ncbi:hypothetical protein J6590_088524 [Homalodisca vitripennis]|nr:hypothetical protein J6590_088524 [Homalodisca vitripennis]
MAKSGVAVKYSNTSLYSSDSTTETSPESPVTKLLPKPTTTNMRPYSEDGDGAVNVTARVGTEIIFDCRLPISGHAPNNFRLKIDSVKREDDGFYKCAFIPQLMQVRKIFLKVTDVHSVSSPPKLRSSRDSNLSGLRWHLRGHFTAGSSWLETTHYSGLYPAGNLSPYTMPSPEKYRGKVVIPWTNRL